MFDYDFLKEYLKGKKNIFITTISKDFLDMTCNWFLSVKNIKENSLVCALDEESYKELNLLNIPSVCLNVSIPKNLFYYDWEEYHKKYALVLHLYLYKHFKGLNAISSDVDVFFIKNPIKKLEKENKGYDFTTMSDKRFDPFLSKRQPDILKKINKDGDKILNFGLTPQKKYGIINGGFSYFDTTKTSNLNLIADSAEKLINEELDAYPKGTEEGTLQNIYNKIIKEKNFNVKILNAFEFVNGSIIQVPYLKEKVINNAFLFHYNFISPDTSLNMKNKKIKLMKENGHWFL